MTARTEPAFSAFSDARLISFGALGDVAVDVARAEAQSDHRALVLCDRTGRVVDLDLRGSEDEIRARATEHPMATLEPGPTHEGAPQQQPATPVAKRGRGRPALGVVAREVTLLPRHWEWLDAQGRNISATLRRLIDEARRHDDDSGARRTARDAAYTALAALAGDLPGFEEATRALFAEDQQRFAREIAVWPDDLQSYALRMAAPCWRET